MVHNDQNQINCLATQLKAPPAACDSDRRRTAPAMFSTASRYTFAVIAAEPNRDLYHRRDNRDAFRLAHNLVRNRFVGCSPDFRQDFGGLVDTLVDIGVV